MRSGCANCREGCSCLEAGFHQGFRHLKATQAKLALYVKPADSGPDPRLAGARVVCPRLATESDRYVGELQAMARRQVLKHGQSPFGLRMIAPSNASVLERPSYTREYPGIVGSVC